jgi:hypothetical protein
MDDLTIPAFGFQNGQAMSRKREMTQPQIHDFSLTSSGT